MNINKMLVLATAAVSMAANAQVTLNDKNANAYDLGYGVEISDFFSTAAVTTISGEELQQTSATNLAQALYGRLPALTALSQGGFSGDENKGASFNIRGYHTLNDKNILILVDGYERPIDRLSVEEVQSGRSCVFKHSHALHFLDACAAVSGTARSVICQSSLLTKNSRWLRVLPIPSTNRA